MHESAQIILSLVRVFNAPIDTVFEAWTNPKVLADWFGPEEFGVTLCEVDLRLGGKYRIVIQQSGGTEINHFGEYVEIVPPNKLSFTWMLENQACRGSANQCAETLVSIDFKSIGQSTEIRLTHERLPNKEAYDGHKFGWNSSFNSLDQFLNSRPG